MYVWTCGGDWDDSVTPGGGPVGECLEANPQLGVAKGGSCGPGEGGAGLRVLDKQGIQSKQGIRVS